MALTTYVNQTLDELLKKYESGVDNSKGHITDDFVRDSLEENKKTYSEIIGAMKGISSQFEGQLNPDVNQDFGYILENFISNALKDNENPSQLYRIILDNYNQEIFNKRDDTLKISERERALVILLSKIYWEALKILGTADPLTGQKYYNVSREARENAERIKGIVGKLLGEALYRIWTLNGKKITKGEIMTNLAKYTSSFYGEWEGVKRKIESDMRFLTPKDEVKDAVMGLVMGLENSYLSFIQGLILAAYNRRSAPEHIINVLKYLSGKDFLKNVFNEMYNEVGNYINQLQQKIAQYLQLNQSAGQQPPLVGQQQGGQSPQVQPPQPAQPGQPGNQPNIQQPVPIQQNQQQPAQQTNQPQQNQQNNQQGQQTP